MSDKPNEFIEPSMPDKPRLGPKVRLGWGSKNQKHPKPPKPPKRLDSGSAPVVLNKIFQAKANNAFRGLRFGYRVKVTSGMITTLQNIVGPRTDPLSRCGGCSRKDCVYCSLPEVGGSPVCSSPGGVPFTAILNKCPSPGDTPFTAIFNKLNQLE
jgi:hypothetical protein